MKRGKQAKERRRYRAEFLEAKRALRTDEQQLRHVSNRMGTSQKETARLKSRIARDKYETTVLEEMIKTMPAKELEEFLGYLPLMVETQIK